MAVEKYVRLCTEDVLDQPIPASRTRRFGTKAILALGGIAILTTGFAIGAGVSVYCGKDLTAGIQGLGPVLAPSNPESPLHGLYERALGVDTSFTTDTDGHVVKYNSSVVATVPGKRPNKYFGPKLSPEQARLRKAAKGLASIEKREEVALERIEESAVPTFSRVMGRGAAVEKRAVWQPAMGSTWTYQLSQVPTVSQVQSGPKYQIWDIDLFDTPASTIQAIHNTGSKVICYFSAGTYEDWRSDVSKFRAGDIGAPMGDWPGENWLNTKSKNVRSIMASRLDLAVSKGCDGVDPDNMDAYNHETGFVLGQNDAVNYITYLAGQASSRGLAIGLKNTGDIIPRVVNTVQYSVEEACYLYDECDVYKPFADVGKPVFHVEYPKGYGVVNTINVAKTTMTAVCACITEYNFSPIVKNNNLDTWQQPCK